MVSVRERLVGANLFSNQPAREASLNGPSIVKSRLRLQARFNLNSEIETTDSADFTDFEEVIADQRTNLFVAKLQGD
jgi:hypothetical protein